MDEIAEKAIEMRKAGATKVVIQETLGLSRFKCTKILNGAGLVTKRVSQNDRDAQVWAMHEEGLSSVEISEKIGLCKATVSRILWEQKLIHCPEQVETKKPKLKAQDKPAYKKEIIGGKKYTDITNDFSGYGTGTYE